MHVQVNISQDGNAVPGFPLTVQPWIGAQTTGPNISAVGVIVKPQTPHDPSIFDGYSGKRWCQAINTVQSTDPGALLLRKSPIENLFCTLRSDGTSDSGCILFQDRFLLSYFDGMLTNILSLCLLTAFVEKGRSGQMRPAIKVECRHE